MGVGGRWGLIEESVPLYPILLLPHPPCACPNSMTSHQKFKGKSPSQAGSMDFL